MERMPARRSSPAAAFSLAELLVTITVVAVIMGFLLHITSGLGGTLARETNLGELRETENFALDFVAGRLSRATLADDQVYRSGADGRMAAEKRSALQFVTGHAATLLPAAPNQTLLRDAVFFTAPLQFTRSAANLESPGAINAAGFYLQYGPEPTGAIQPGASRLSASAAPPAPRYRYRLMMMLRPVEDAIYSSASATPDTLPDGALLPHGDWFTQGLADHSFVVAENIAGFIVLPQTRLATGPAPLAFAFDSRAGAAGLIVPHQLPRSVDIIVVALDETAAQMLSANSGGAPPADIEALFAGLFQSEATQADDFTTLRTRAAALAPRVNLLVRKETVILSEAGGGG